MFKNKKILVITVLLFILTILVLSKLGFQKDKTEEIFISKIYEEIKRDIIRQNNRLYKLENFRYDYEYENIGEKKGISFNIYADMILIQHPSDSPYVKEMI